MFYVKLKDLYDFNAFDVRKVTFALCLLCEKVHFILELDQDFDKVSNTLTRASVSVCQLLLESKQSMFLMYLFGY